MDEVTSKKTKRPLSVWELPKLLTPVHTHRRTERKPGPVREHFPAILGFVYRNRFVVGSQVQRRFANYLPSDRTARRHLAELQDLGWLDTVPTRAVGPLFPKVYFVPGRGVRKLRDAYAEKGIKWEPSVIDRRGRHTDDGYSAEHVLHEVLISEFLLNVWEEAAREEGLSLLEVQRRSLSRHPAFQISQGRRTVRLIPDGMFVVQNRGRGMCCCFVELDLGTMGHRQLSVKFARYDAWSHSDQGRAFLIDLYGRHGAQRPRPAFRILVVAKGRDNRHSSARCRDIARALNAGSRVNLGRVWIADAESLANAATRCVTAAVWEMAGEKNGTDAKGRTRLFA